MYFKIGVHPDNVHLKNLENSGINCLAMFSACSKLPRLYRPLDIISLSIAAGSLPCIARRNCWKLFIRSAGLRISGFVFTAGVPLLF